MIGPGVVLGAQLSQSRRQNVAWNLGIATPTPCPPGAQVLRKEQLPPQQSVDQPAPASMRISAMAMSHHSRVVASSGREGVRQFKQPREVLGLVDRLREPHDLR